MERGISQRAAGLALGTLFSVTYVLCVLWDIALPRYAMHQVWAPLLPGFAWLGIGGFLIGLVETFVYGVYGGVFFAYLYSYLIKKTGGY